MSMERDLKMVQNYREQRNHLNMPEMRTYANSMADALCEAYALIQLLAPEPINGPDGGPLNSENTSAPENQPRVLPAGINDAAWDVLAERRRQVEAEGWTPEHDNEHCNGELALAASCYALRAHEPERLKAITGPSNWPWDFSWWKPGSARRMLVKAAALLLAEIERIDRTTQA